MTDPPTTTEPDVTTAGPWHDTRRAHDSSQQPDETDATETGGPVPEMNDDTQLGPVGQRIMLENDHVRVWQVHLEPGQTQRLHRHDHPYVVVSVHSAINLIHTVDGQEIEAPEPTGHVVYRPAGAVHSLTNVGETTYVGRIVELLDLE